MSSYKVTLDNGASKKELSYTLAKNPMQAAFLAGVEHAAKVVMLAASLGVLDTMLDLAGEEAAINSLIRVAALENITVTGDPDQIITTSSRDPRDYGI